MANMSAKFDEEAHNGLVSIMFKGLSPYMFIVTLTINRFVLSLSDFMKFPPHISDI